MADTYFMMRHSLTIRGERTTRIVNSDQAQDHFHLTPEGEELAQNSVNALKQSEDEIDFIYASPFIRTTETAQIAGKIFHREIQTDERLREVGKGEWEGKPNKEYIKWQHR